MRNYAMNRAEMVGSFDPSPLALLRNWLVRRQLMKLRTEDNGASEYNGVSAADLEWAIGLPLNTDPRLALEDRLFRKARQFGKPAVTVR